MKKVFILAAIMILWAVTVFGAGTTVITSVTPYANGYTHVLVTWTADAADHTSPDLTISGYLGQKLCQIWTNPGSTKPTDNYGITLKYDGGDILQGGGANRDQDNTEVTYPVIVASAQGGCVYVPGDLVLSIGSNSVNSATGTILLVFQRQGY